MNHTPDTDHRLLRRITPCNLLSFGPETPALDCTNAYAKGKQSYVILGKLTPAVLEQYLPSFVRACRILNRML